MQQIELKVNNGPNKIINCRNCTKLTSLFFLYANNVTAHKCRVSFYIYMYDFYTKIAAFSWP